MPSYSSIKPSATFGTDAGKTFIQAGVDSATIASLIPTTTAVSSSADLSPTGNLIGDQALIGSNLYIWNGSGWYRIALINASPTWDSSGQPAVTYTLDADSPQDATIINLSASDPDGLPINYSYITSGSMDSMATISQDSSIFTITPKTVAEVGEGVELTGSITFRASDGVNILPQVSSFTLTFSSIVGNSNYTTLLATATGGSDNNNITDASSNSHSITIGGDTYAGTFSPYRHGGYSAYFDGSGDSLTIADDVSIDLSTGDFTLEAWIYLEVTSGNRLIIDRYTSGNNGSYQLYYRDTGNSIAFWTVADGIVAQDPSSSTIKANTWHHVVATRESGTVKIYVDGTQVATGACTTNFDSTLNLGIGAQISTSTNYLTGYISDLRIVKGTALYTSNFTPPTERLTAITNTSLLTCHLPYIADGSTNSHSITVNGDVSTKPFSPYNYEGYNAINHGGSVYFDGTGDYLSISNQEISGDLTYEGWFYQTVAQSATYRTLISSSTYASGVPFRVYTNNTNIQVWTDGSNGAEITVPFKAYTWFHIAIVRSSGTWTTYVNGKSVGTTTVGGTYDFASTTGWSIGGSQTGSYPFTGYASDVKLTNSAVYTADFTPPTAPISSSGSELHIKGTDASIIDKSQTTNIKLVGGTNGTTTQAKFANTRSMYFDAAGDYIDITEGFIPLRTSDFTIETWFYPTANPSNHEGIFSNGTHSSGNWLALLYQTNRIIRYDIGGGSSSNLSTTAVSLNTWCHIALCRSGGNIRLYINGTQEHTEANSSDLDYETALIGERIGLTGYALNSAYLQDFRITKGLARYTANFTPPTASLEG